MAFILDTDKELSDWKIVKELLEKPEYRQQQGFLSAMYIQDVGFFRSHHAEVETDPAIGTFEATPDNALALFKIHLFSSLSRFPRADRTWTPGLDRYYSNTEVDTAEVELVKKKGEIPQVIIKYQENEL